MKIKGKILKNITRKLTTVVRNRDYSIGANFVLKVFEESKIATFFIFNNGDSYTFEVGLDEDSGEDINIVLDSKDIDYIARKMKDDEDVILELDKNKDKLHVHQGNKKAELQYMKPDGYYPEEANFHTNNEFSIYKDLGKVYDAVNFASQDEAKPHLCGVHINNKKIEATDGHFLYCAKTAEENNLHEDTFIVPAKVIDNIEKIMGKSDWMGLINENNNRACIAIDSAGILTKINFKFINSKFPPTDQVIPKYEKSFNIEKDKLFQAVDYVGKKEREQDTCGIKITCKQGKIKVEKINDGFQGVALEQYINVDEMPESVDFSIALSRDILEPSLRVMKNKFELKYKENEQNTKSALMLEDEEKQIVIMPLNV